MAIQKLVCSNCRGELVWNPDDRTFTCKHCGTKFQTDNEFTYRIVDEAEIEKIKQKEREKKSELKNDLWVLFLIGLVIVSFPLAIKFLIWAFSR